MNILPIIAIGAAALYFSSSKKSSSTQKSDDKPNTGGGILIEGIPVNPIPKKPEGKIIIKETPTCTSLEYIKNGKCHPFWIEGETDKVVLQKINERADKFENKDYATLCEDEYVNGDYTGEVNKNRMNIVKDVIIELWGPDTGLTKNQLPPKPIEPEWVKMVWIKVNHIFSTKICFNEA